MGLIACAEVRPAPSLPVASVSRPPSAAPEPEPTRERFDRVGDGDSYLDDDFAKREPRRALLARLDDGAWDLAGAKSGYLPVHGAKGQSVRLRVVVAERHPEHLRMMHQSSALRLTFYLGNTSFHEVTQRRAMLLASDGEPFDHGCGVTLPPGSPLQAKPERLGLRRVHYVHRALEANGGLRPEAIGYVFQQDREQPTSASNDCVLQGPVTLLDAPGGRVVANLTATRYRCERLQDPQSGVQKVRAEVEEARVVGFVPQLAVLSGSSHGRFGRSHRARPPFGLHQTRVYLWPGDRLYQPGTKNVVGRVLQRSMRAADSGPVDDGMHRVTMRAYGHGYVEVDIDDATHDAAATKQALWLARVRFPRVRVTGSITVALVKRDLDYARPSLARC